MEPYSYDRTAAATKPWGDALLAWMLDLEKVLATVVGNSRSFKLTKWGKPRSKGYGWQNTLVGQLADGKEATVETRIAFDRSSSGVDVAVTFRSSLADFRPVVAETLAFGESPDHLSKQLVDFFSKLK